MKQRKAIVIGSEMPIVLNSAKLTVAETLCDTAGPDRAPSRRLADGQACGLPMTSVQIPATPPVAALVWCEALIRRQSSSFYRAFRHLPRDRAQAVFAIYAFYRMADDAMDVNHDKAAILALDGDLKRFEAGGMPESPVWPALRWAFDNWPLEIEPFREMLAGQLQNGDFRQPADYDELLRHCYRVAGTVGSILAPLLATPVTEPVRRVAIDLGIAVQLTNILRNVGADYRLGRIYLPRDWMDEAGVSAEDLAGSTLAPEAVRLWARLADEAERRYAGIRRDLALFDRRARLPVLLSLLYYRAILWRCRTARDRLLNKRIFLPDWQKALILLQAHATVRFMGT